ncbi:MAG TPA: right-handed parallel beta-helix repeat-containing protein, partial [Geminicoccaceae bacterium]|nr:right-handed parallel beta-helix repeat-containing protein [Geminicoccaceae bacterium]
MAIFTVTTAQDVVNPNDGKLSLREAVAQANATAAADTIRFATGLEGQTLVLTGGELTLSRDVRIDGDRNDDGQAVTLDGNDNGRLLRITGGGTDVALADLTLTNGQTDQDGGAIFLDGRSLRLDGCTIRDCRTTDANAEGGGIFATGGGRVTVADSAILNNFGYGGGGGIVADSNVSLVVRDSELSGNVGFTGAGAIGVQDGSSLVLEDSVLTGNGRIGMDYLAFGGAVGILNATTTIARSTIA